MPYITFVTLARSVLPVSHVFTNPGGGTSTIVSVTGTHICYQRKRSKITVSFRDLYDAYTHFRSGRCSSNDLKAFRPSVFDSQARPAGHGCNCTFFFLLLGNMGLCSPIHGTGKSGSPFWVNIP